MPILFKLKSLWQRLSGPGVISSEEIEGALRLPVIAIIPHIERRRNQDHPYGSRLRRIDLEGRWRSRLLSHFPPNAQVAMAYESLVRDLLDRSRLQRQKVWLLAGCVAGEGTSLTCMNMAIAAERQGIKCLIIEGHTRAPRISRVFRLNLQPGLTGCLQRSLNVSNAIQKSTIENVQVLPAGHSIAYPESLWGSPAFHRMLAEVRSAYDLVLLEGPPAVLYPDVAILADKVDGIILIHQYGRTPPERVRKVVEKLGASQDHLLGVLLNDVPVR